MDFHSLLNVALDTGDKIDVLWGMFISVHAAILGALFLTDSKLNKFGVFILVLVYLSFAYLNLKSLNASYELLQAVLDDISHHIPDSSHKNSPNLQSYLKGVDVNSMKKSSVAIHVLSAVVIALATYRKVSSDVSPNLKTSA